MGNTWGRGVRYDSWLVTVGLSLLFLVLLVPSLSLANPAVDATLTDFPFTDPVGPGDTIDYEALISNSGDMPATSVTFDDQSGGNNTTLSIGTLRTTPLCRDDSFTTRPDTVLNGTSVLTNDTDPDGTGVVCIASGGSCIVAPLNFMSAQGGSVALNVDGTFTYTPPMSFIGTDTFTYAIKDIDGNDCLDAVGTATTATASIAVTNETPVANAQMLSINEDTVLPITLTGSDADLDDLTFSITTGPTNGTLSVVTNVPDNSMSSDSATLTYTPAADFNGSDSFTFQVDDGNGGLDTASVDISIDPQQDLPTANAMLLMVNEDTVLPITLTGSDIDLDDLTFSITTNPTNGTLSVVTNVPDNGISSDSATVTYTPTANFNGSDSFTFQVDDGNGNINTADVDITVDPINDAPSITLGGNQSVAEDAGAQSVASFATGFAPGGGMDEAGQAILDFVVSNDNNSLFTTQPDIDTAGTLTYTPVANANGIATVSVQVQDDGGTANGGVDTSPAQTFTITVNAVNDAPSFTATDPPTVNEDAGAQSVVGWATFTAGPATESSQTVVAYTVSNVSNAALFSAQPSVATNGTLSYTPAANANGTSTFDVTVQDDGGTANGGVDTSVVQTFTITVNAVNDAPSFTATDPPTVNEDAGVQSVVGWATFTAGPATESSQTVVAYTVSSVSNAALFSAQPSVATNGTLSYTPAANANGTSTFQVTVQDNGGTANGGVDTSDPQSFTITVTPVNDPPTITSPPSYSVHTNIAIDVADGTGDLLDVGVSDVDSAGPFTLGSVPSTTVNGGTLSINATGSFHYNPPVNGTGADTFGYQICDAGTPLPPACVSVTATLNVSGLAIVFVDATAAAGGNGTLERPVQTLAAGLAALSAGGGSSNLFLGSGSYPQTAVQTLANNVRIFGQGSTVSDFETLYGISPPETAPVNSIDRPLLNQARPVVSSTTGCLALDVGASNTLRGFEIGPCAGDAVASGASFGTLTVPSDNMVINTTGRALNLTSGTLTATFASITSTGGANNLNLNTIGGTSSLGSGALSGASGAAVNVNAGTGTLSYGGSVTNTAAARLVNITNKNSGGVTLAGTLSGTGSSTGINVASNTGGTYTFSGTSKTLSTGANTGVTLAANTGATINFTGGGLALTTTSGTGFGATGGGTVTVQGSGNTLTSTTGTALNLNSITVGASHMTFRSIASNGGNAAGIIMQSTIGSPGTLFVTGTGTANSGGIIQNKSGGDVTSGSARTLTGTTDGVGVYLRNASAVSLDRMDLQTFSNFAIFGDTVAGFTINNSTLGGTNGNNAGQDEGGLKLAGLTGTAGFLNTTFGGTSMALVTHVVNTAGTLNLTVSGSTISNPASATGDDGMLLEAYGTATITALVENNTFTANRGDHFQAAAGNNAAGSSGNLNITFRNNTLTGGHTTALGQGVTINAAGQSPAYAGTVIYDIDNNTINSAILSAITVNLGSSGPAALFRGFVRNNDIGTQAVVNSGSAQGFGIAIDAHGNGTHTLSVTDNVVRQAFDRAISVLANDGNGVLNLTVQGNDLAVSADPGGSRESFFLNNASTTSNIFGLVDSHTVRLDLGGAGALANILTHGVGAPDDFRIRQRFDSRIEMPGYGGTAFDTAAVVAYIRGRNTGSAGEPGSATANDSLAVTTDGFFNGTVPVP